MLFALGMMLLICVPRKISRDGYAKVAQQAVPLSLGLSLSPRERGTACWANAKVLDLIYSFKSLSMQDVLLFQWFPGSSDMESEAF